MDNMSPIRQNTSRHWKTDLKQSSLNLGTPLLHTSTQNKWVGPLVFAAETGNSPSDTSQLSFPLPPPPPGLRHLLQEHFATKLPHVPCNLACSGQGLTQESHN